MEWSNEEIVRFIKEIEKYPTLWDNTNEHYRNAEQKKEYFEQIGEKFKCGAHEAERKWGILCGQFRRERQKIASASVAKPYKPTWFGFAPMSFVHKRFIKKRKIKRERVEKERSESKEETTSFYTEDFEPKIFKAAKRSIASVEETTLDVQPNTSAKRIAPEERVRDEHDVFAESVAIKLRKIKGEATLLRVQRGIDNLLYNALIP